EIVQHVVEPQTVIRQNVAQIRMRSNYHDGFFELRAARKQRHGRFRHDDLHVQRERQGQREKGRHRPRFGVTVASARLHAKEDERGKTVGRVPRKVMVHEIEVLKVDGRDITLHVRCSKGTYIRTLCADIGEAL
ncbi:MAG: hypothetical protein C4293_05280, partial [Nitrospiraceae bacterium]